MFIDSTTGRRVNIYGPFKGRSSLTDAAVREALGVIEIADEPPPPNFDAELYFVQEDWETTTRPYTTYRLKPQAMIDEILYNRGMAKIRALELAEGYPRGLREFMLEQPGAAQKPWFHKVNGLHTEIESIKAGLPPKPPTIP